MLGLPAKPIAHAKTILRPRQDRLLLEAPCVEHIERLAHVAVRCPQPEDAVFGRNARHVHFADLLDRHLRIRSCPAVRGVVLAGLIGPRRVCDNDAVRSAPGKRWRVGANNRRLANDLEALVSRMAAPAAVHRFLEHAKLFWFGSRRLDYLKALVDLLSAFAEQPPDDLG